MTQQAIDTSKQYKYINFKWSTGDLMPITVTAYGQRLQRGSWERKDGSEGGALWIDLESMIVADYDGAFDLPKYVWIELGSIGVYSSIDEDKQSIIDHYLKLGESL